VADSGQRSDAYVRSAIVAVAAERYRLAQGHWPDTLVELKEAGYLKTIPTDPYDGRPLRWRRLDDGQVGYAVGPDLVDNGGNLADRRKPQEPGTDIGFRLWDVAKRRQLPKLDAILAGKGQPDDDGERLALAQQCMQGRKKRYAAASRFFAGAFANDATLADDMEQQHRYNAACAAALAGCGQGNDADTLDDNERASLRKQAVAWLRADLAHWTEIAGSDKPAGAAPLWLLPLQHWLDDADLAGIRDKDALDKLPADEREVCQKLWADVAVLLKKAGEGQ
jgi:hypothetical protein